MMSQNLGRTSARRFYRAGVILAASLAASCSSHPPARAGSAEGKCIATTVGEIWHNPKPFAGRRVCLSGYFGRIVPYGEDSPKLYATPEEADATRLERFVTLGIPFTIPVQERLARYSVQPVRVEGIVTLEHPCLSEPVATPSDSLCSPPPSLRISRARLNFADAVQFP